MTRNKIVVGIGLIPLTALIIISVRLRQRAAFRNEMRPLVQENLSDFTEESVSRGGSVVGPAISRREKRIAEIKLFEVGHYRNARDRIVHLMEAEDSYLADSEEEYETGIQLQTDATQVGLAKTELGIVWNDTPPDEPEFMIADGMCSALHGVLVPLDTAMGHERLASVLPEIIEDDYKEGALAWNRAYGWMKWMGLDVDPHNPFSPSPNLANVPNNWKSDLKKAQSFRLTIAKALVVWRCGDTK